MCSSKIAIMKKVIAFLLVLGFLAGAAQARSPMVGDLVRIGIGVTSGVLSYEGVVTGVEDGMICLDCWSMSTVSATDEDLVDREYPFDVCIGTGAIMHLVWLSD
jgi:hypothetical protein